MGKKTQEVTHLLKTNIPEIDIETYIDNFDSDLVKGDTFSVQTSPPIGNREGCMAYLTEDAAAEAKKKLDKLFKEGKCKVRRRGMYKHVLEIVVDFFGDKSYRKFDI